MSAGADHETLIRLRRLLGASGDRSEFLREALALMHDWSGCEAVGIRLREGNDYPYAETRGFPPEFVRDENGLCVVDEAGAPRRDACGNPVLECMCGNVIAGRFDPTLPFFTPFGSFWTNSTTDLLAATSEADRQARTRNRCHGEGYESVALVPLRHDDERLGLLQFNDSRRDRFDRDRIELFEQFARGVAFIIAQSQISARVRADRAETRALLDASDESVFLIDREGVVLEANAITAKRLGMTREELIGRDIFAVIPPDVAANRREYVARARRTGQPQRFTDQRQGLWFEHAVYPIRDERGEVTRLAIYGRDISARVKAAADLANAENVYRTIIDANPLSILLVRDGRYIYANPIAAERLGYRPEELVGVPVERTILPQDMVVVRERMRRAAAGLANPPVEMSLPRRDGTFLLCESSSATINLPDGPAILVMGQDITARKQAEEVVRRQAMVLDQITDRVTITDFDGTIVYVNDAECRALKRSREELIGQNVAIYGDDPQRGATQQEILARTLAEGRWRGDVVNIAADGEQNIMDCRTLVLRDEQGRPVALCGIATDVTELRRQEQATRESERRYRLLYEHLPVGYKSLDEDGRMLDVNQAWLDIFGYSRDEVIGRDFADFLAPDQVASYRENFRRFKVEGHIQVEYVMHRKDGGAITMLFVGRIGRDAAGRFARTHCICTDVTEQRALEQQFRQAQRLEAVGRLAAGVAHDFNNQLTVIRGYCDMLLAKLTPADPLWRPLTEIMRAGERARSTTSHLLSYSRRQLLDPQFTNLAELLAELHSPFATMIGEDIKLVVEAPPDLPPVIVDRGAMHQALMNLVVNARDAMPGGGELALGARRLELDAEVVAGLPDLEPGPHVLIEVRDTGAGMDAAALEQVFEPFYTTKPKGKGTGLGLPMVQGFVRQSHGTITIDSAPGRGTTVSIYLPVASAPAEEPPQSAEEVRPAVAPRGTETILVVEDDAAVRAMVVDCLAHAGYQVLEAGGPREAVALACAHGESMRLMVTDLIMPDMNGAELATAIQAVHAHVKVLFISGYHDLNLRPDVADVLLKPFSPNELVKRVRRALDGAAMAPSPSSSS